MGTWPFSTHTGMFVVQLQALGSKEQADYWVPKAKKLQVLGCYAQTELGHGSDVQGIQTSATFDEDSNQFIIHTPRLQAAKFWPGELAKVANHAAVIARMIVKGKDYGPQTFVVPLRSMDDHMPLPGVEVGDIGPKHGYQNKDNGYAVFTNVRVPRSALLCRYIRVSRDGKVSREGNPRVAYFTMMLNRILIIQEAYGYLSRPLTIALRYSCFRSQFKTADGNQERKVINYQNQQYRLVPYLASAYAFFFATQKARALFTKLEAEIAKGDASNLGELHRVLSAFKTFITWETLQGCEECRQACGGHGFLEYAGISQEALDYTARCTYEGDNGVLSQQIGRALVKQLDLARRGKQVDSNLQYLTKLPSLLKAKSKIQSVKDLNSEQILEALQIRAGYLIMKVNELIQELQAQGISEGTINSELVQSDLLKASKAHTEFVIYECFFLGIQSAYEKQEVDSNLKKHLKNLLKVYGLKCLSVDMMPLLVSNYFSDKHGPLIEEALKYHIKQLRPYLLALVEGFGQPDEMIFSAIGDKKLSPYKTLIEWTKEYNPMNKVDPLEGFKEFMLPLVRPKL